MPLLAQFSVLIPMQGRQEVRRFLRRWRSTILLMLRWPA
jgi:hypothetical protein